MESRDVVSVSRRVSKPVFWSLGLDGFRSRSRALSLETLHRLFLSSSARRRSLKMFFKNACSKFSRSKRSVAKLSLLLRCLRDGENNLPSTPLKVYTEFN